MVPLTVNNARSLVLFCVAIGATGRVVAATADSPMVDEQPTGALQEITVTARKVEQRLQDVPISMTAVSGSDLQAQGLSNAQDIVQSVPGIAVSSAGPAQAKYEIRGLSSVGGESPTIGFYLDETPVTPPASATTGKSAIDPDLYDLARVEVLRGPQGTLYGAGSMGGTVKLVTNAPNTQAFAASTQTTGSGTDGGGVNYAQKGMLNLPLVQDRLALRIVATYAHDSGWIDRVVVPDFSLETNSGTTRGTILGQPVARIHRDVNDEDLSGARISLLYEATDNLTITPAVFYQHIYQGGMNTFDSDPGTLAHYQPFDEPEPFTDRFTVYSLPITYDMDDISLTSATAYWSRHSSQLEDGSEAVQDGLQLPAFDVAAGGVGPVQAFEFDDTHQFSQEVRVAARGSHRVQWLIGGFYSDYSDQLYTGGGNIPGLLTAAGGAFGTANLFNVHEPLQVKEAAAFGNVTAKLTDSLTVEAGLRYYSYRSNLSSTATGFAYGGDTPVIATASASASGLNPMLDVSYHLNPDLMLYATAAKGFREGAGNFPIPTTGSVGSVCLQNLQAIGRTSAPGQYDPDTVWSYEIGEKGRFLDQRLTFNSDVFYIRWSDVQQPVALACGLGFTANGSAANIRGAEAELQAEIVTGLTFSQGVGYAHSAFAQGFAASGIVAGQSLFDAPQWTINSSLRYDRPVGDFTLVGLVRNSYAGSSEDLSYQVNRLPGRDRLDLRAGVEARKWSAFLFVDNVLNRHNILENIDLLTFTGPSYNRVATDRPLTAGIDISFTF